MNTSVVLSQSDKDRLQSLLRHQGTGPWLELQPSTALAEIVYSAGITDDSSILTDYVGLDDEVVLVSLTNPRDSFSLQIVLPHEADLDRDRIPISMAVSLAVLGRRKDGKVSWLAPQGTREMRILKLNKCLEHAVGA